MLFSLENIYTMKQYVDTRVMAINVVCKDSFHPLEEINMFARFHLSIMSGTTVNIRALQYSSIKSILMECIKRKSNTI